MNFYYKTIQFQPNTKFEIAKATEEMLSMQNSKIITDPSPLKEKINLEIKKAGFLHGGFEVRPLATIASVFLEQEGDLGWR